MRHQRILGVAAAGLFAAVIFLGANSLSWIGSVFPGFLVLENRVVASAGLSSWGVPETGSLAYHEILEVDGHSLDAPGGVLRRAQETTPGTIVVYRTRKGGEVKEVSFATQRFTLSDWVWFFGFYFVVGLAFAGVSLSLLFLAPEDSAARGSAAFLGFIGLWALTSVDLYGPYHFFRVHALCETLVVAGTLHMALVFPAESGLAKRAPWILKAIYGLVLVLALGVQLTLFHPDLYVLLHQAVISTMGFSWLALIGAMLHAYRYPVDLESQQRVKVVAIAFAASVGSSLFFLSTQIGGGSGTEKLLAAAIFMPISVGYAVLKDDLLEVDEFLRTSLVYALLTALIATIYAGGVAAIEGASRRAGFSSGWLSAFVFAGFSVLVMLPVRDRIQSVVDRLFYRSAYDFRMVMEKVSTRLSRVSDLDSITSDVESAVTESLEPSFVELSVFSQTASKDLRVLAIERMTDEDDGSLSIPFRIAGKNVALMRIGPKRSGGFYSGADRALLQTLANQAALAIDNALAIETVQELNRTLEKRVEERTTELEQAVERLKDAQVHLVQSERMAAIGELSAGVAHEVNNPLNFARNSLATLKTYASDVAGIAGSLSSLQGVDGQELVRRLGVVQAEISEVEIDRVGEDMGELVGILTDALDRTAKLVADLRDFAAPTRGEIVPVDVDASLDSTLQLMRHEIRNANAEIRKSVEANLSRVAGNTAALNQVFLNLVKNALESLRSEERVIWIEVSRTDAGVAVVVSDSGVGLEDEEPDRLFEPFYTTKDAGSGTGLGLAMCRRIVEDHRGSISIAERPGGGAQVRVELPGIEYDSAPA